MRGPTGPGKSPLPSSIGSSAESPFARHGLLGNLQALALYSDGAYPPAGASPHGSAPCCAWSIFGRGMLGSIGFNLFPFHDRYSFETMRGSLRVGSGYSIVLTCLARHEGIRPSFGPVYHRVEPVQGRWIMALLAVRSLRQCSPYRGMMVAPEHLTYSGVALY